MHSFFQGISALLDVGISPVIRVADSNLLGFHKEANGFLVDNGQMAHVTNMEIKDNDSECILTIDFSEYLEANLKLEKPAYLNQDTGSYNLSYQACFGKLPKTTEEICLSTDVSGEVGIGLEIVEDPSKRALFDEFQKSDHKHYIDWLEDKAVRLSA